MRVLPCYCAFSCFEAELVMPLWNPSNEGWFYDLVAANLQKNTALKLMVRVRCKSFLVTQIRLIVLRLLACQPASHPVQERWLDDTRHRVTRTF